MLIIFVLWDAIIIIKYHGNYKYNNYYVYSYYTMYDIHCIIYGINVYDT